MYKLCFALLCFLSISVAQAQAIDHTKVMSAAQESWIADQPSSYIISMLPDRTLIIADDTIDEEFYPLVDPVKNIKIIDACGHHTQPKNNCRGNICLFPLQQDLYDKGYSVCRDAVEAAYYNSRSAAKHKASPQ